MGVYLASSKLGIRTGGKAFKLFLITKGGLLAAFSFQGRCIAFSKYYPSVTCSGTVGVWSKITQSASIVQSGLERKYRKSLPYNSTKLQHP